jgi:coenzyme Q-binding protein COQ10
MFALVADVENYPKFLPLCEALKIRGRRPQDDGTTVLVADMTVAYKVMRETFTSRVRLDPTQPSIDVEYLDGPFRRLDNHWTFEALPGGGTLVRFFIEWEFRSRTLGVLMGAMFERAFRRFAEAFEARASVVYGPRGRPGTA